MNCNPALITVNLDSLALVIKWRLFHDNAIVIFVSQILVETVSRRNYLGRAASVLSESPLYNVEHMGAPVRHITASSLLIPAPGTPAGIAAIRIEKRVNVRIIINIVTFREWSEPSLPVKPCRNGFLRTWTLHRERLSFPAAYEQFNLANLPEIAFTGHIGSVDELLA